MKDIKFKEQKFFCEFWKGLWIYVLEPIIVLLIILIPFGWLIQTFGLASIPIGLGLFLVWLFGWFITGTIRGKIK